jgi:hypothetical protein
MRWFNGMLRGIPMVGKWAWLARPLVEIRGLSRWKESNRPVIRSEI